jgi:hypothetical protein
MVNGCKNMLRARLLAQAVLRLLWGHLDLIYTIRRLHKISFLIDRSKSITHGGPAGWPVSNILIN